MATVLRFVDGAGALRLNLNGTALALGRRFALGEPELRQVWLSQDDADGATQAASSLGLAVMSVPLILRPQVSAAAMKALLDSLNTELNRSTNIIEYKPTGWAVTYFLDTYRASLISMRRGEDVLDPAAGLQDGAPLMLSIPRAPKAGLTVAGVRDQIPL